jgi:hypothetical protein
MDWLEPSAHWLGDWRVWAIAALGLAVLALIIVLAMRRRRPRRVEAQLEPADSAPAAAPSTEPSEERMIGWRPLYPYISQRRFTQWRKEELSQRVDEESCPLRMKLFISHRWRTPGDPDPACETLPAVIEYLSRVYMAANGYLDPDSFLVKELVVGDELREALHERSLQRCTCGSVGWLDLKGVLAPSDVFFERVSDTQRRRAFYKLLKHVQVWYDYASLPQARASAEERALLDRALDRLAGIVARSEVLALWGMESVNRAWCVFEALVAEKLHFCAPAQAKFDAGLQAQMKAAGYEDLAHYRGRPGLSITIHVNGFRASVAGLGEREIEAYLREHGLECTKDEDFARVARLIHRYLAAPG